MKKMYSAVTTFVFVLLIVMISVGLVSCELAANAKISSLGTKTAAALRDADKVFSSAQDKTQKAWADYKTALANCIQDSSSLLDNSSIFSKKTELMKCIGSETVPSLESAKKSAKMIAALAKLDGAMAAEWKKK